jgi:hypothetical protein
MKIFWSWQSDTHQPSGRYFVADVLRAVASGLSGLEAEAADRPETEGEEAVEAEGAVAPEPNEDELAEPPAGAVTIDHDTQGVGGSPPIAETILRKIREAAVFVADVTPVAKTVGGKYVPNPNVMIELGYALKSLGHERIILVMNQAEGGKRERLPFDLKHWRGPITYNLKREASEEVKKAVFESLRADLRQAVGPCLTTARRAQAEELRRVTREPVLTLELARENSGVHTISQALPAMAFKSQQQLMEQHPFIEKKKSNYAVNPTQSKGLNSALRSMGIAVPVSGWDQDDIDGYNSRVEDYFKAYAFYEADLKSHTLDQMRTLSVRFVVVNSGSAPATNVDVNVYFPPQISIFDSDEEVKEPKAPKPPDKAPLGRVSAIFAPVPPRLNLKAFHKTHRVDSDSGFFSFHAENVKHHHEFTSPPLKVRPQTLEDITDFEVQYAITSNELVDMVEGRLVVKIVRDDSTG